MKKHTRDKWKADRERRSERRVLIPYLETVIFPRMSTNCSCNPFSSKLLLRKQTRANRHGNRTRLWNREILREAWIRYRRIEDMIWQRKTGEFYR